MKIHTTIKTIGLSLIALGCSLTVNAQQDPQYTQYMYNTGAINPAYVGSKSNLSIFGLYRTQWVGLEGAPKTAHVSVSTPLGESGLGLGVNFINDRLGVMDENTISVDLSYTIDLNYDYKMAFGLKTTANLLSVDYQSLRIHNTADPVSQENISNKFNPNIGAGVYVFSDKAYVGLSVPMLLERDRYNDNYDGQETVLMRQKMHYFLMGGYVFDLSDNLKFKPAFLAKATSGAPLQVDLTANFLIAEKVTLGAAYRWDAAISALAGFQVNDNLFVGYSYDAETTALRAYNSGSHEIVLRFDLFNRLGKINAPRFF
ncbi:PorP/SprF family type IX secretion system membrane protein [Myroides pelagicus]|uniref:Type IX secretion system membrane protein PorP/SprF n=1 Tax=Myroides pelagicus TaxID=270914 RepID=A0A7K1GLG7_9FLAO|nr:type IX secretion system membrane protein PorP/SprF [Myroides pelagicus]MEC4114173.1 type IX secretion system membrane protein PorP/SprF [Myroides pelagicus]MTH29732.1 type IX secretion system membrane protein PorP/SprF [Myroides pelagicus]